MPDTALPTPPARCSALNKHGRPCGSGVAPGAEYCFVHDPARQDAAAAARRRGGENRGGTLMPPTEPCDLSSMAAMRIVLQETIDRVRSGKENATIAKTVIAAVAAARAILDQEEFFARLAALEAAQASRTPPEAPQDTQVLEDFRARMRESVPV